jgi:hypothetical protein
VVILALMKKLFLLHNALVILLTKILVITKRNIWLITNHSSHHWIFSLTRSMMTFLVYIENQNFTRIHIEEMILQVLILFQQTNCWWIWLTCWLLSKREYNHFTNNEVSAMCWRCLIWLMWFYWKGQSGMYNLETLALLGTRDTWRRQANTKSTTQHRQLERWATWASPNATNGCHLSWGWYLYASGIWYSM